MMNKLRKNTAFILWILLFAFIGTIIFSWGMGGFKSKASKGIIAVINGLEVKYDTYMNSIQREYARMRDEQGELSDRETRQIRQRVWDEMINEILIGQEVKKADLKATDEEIVFFVRNSPPDFLISSEAFQTDGQFDYEKYLKALGDPSIDWTPIEEFLRHEIPKDKLRRRVLASVFASDNEVKEKFIEDNQKATASYIFFDPNTFQTDSTEISEAEILSYYRDHQEDYRVPEKRKIDYVLFHNLPTLEDSAETWEDGRELVERAREGEDFALLVQDFSQDRATISRDGDLGYFPRGRWPDEFDKAVFGAKIGGVIGPLKTNRGLHIVKIEDKRTIDGGPEVKASHILLTFEPSADTREVVRESAYDFAEAVKEDDFYETAEIWGYEVRNSDFFAAGGFIPGIGRSISASRSIFNADLEDVSESFPMLNGWFVFRVSTIEKSTIPKLRDGVRDIIMRTLIRQKNLVKAGQVCTDVRSKMEDGTDFEKLATVESLGIKTIDREFTIGSYLPGIGRDRNFTAAAFKLNPGDISSPVEGIKGYYLIKLLSKSAFDSTAFDKERENLKDKILRQKQQTAYAAWLRGLQNRAKIEDYRYYYFRDY